MKRLQEKTREREVESERQVESEREGEKGHINHLQELSQSQL